jgi:predicted nucleic acid-binding protein
MLNILRGSVVRKRLPEHEAKRALHLLLDVPIKLIPLDNESRFSILEASLRFGLSVYDAAYLSLADQRGLPLLTADKKILSLITHFSWIHPA